MFGGRGGRSAAVSRPGADAWGLVLLGHGRGVRSACSLVEEVALRPSRDPVPVPAVAAQHALSTGDGWGRAREGRSHDADVMAWVYILECSDKSFYVGSTKDLELRMWQHRSGEGAAYTRRRRPVRLVWSLHFDRIDEAFDFEKRVQGWGRAKRLALIEGRLGDLPTLSGRSYAALQRRRRLRGERD